MQSGENHTFDWERRVRELEIAIAEKTAALERERQIETGLEKVRSRSGEMRRSEEITGIAGMIFSELRKLDLALNRVLIWIFNDDEKYTTWWSANPEVESSVDSFRISYNSNPVFLNYLQAWQQKQPVHLFTLSGQTKKNWEDFLFETELSQLPSPVKEGMRSEETLYTVSVISDFGIMMLGSLEPLPEESINTIQRFGRVFQQSYTRYQDVQKAETQAKEAEIQLGLERVRARSLSMHSTEELQDVVNVAAQQLMQMGIDMDGGVFIAVNDELADDFPIWAAAGAADYVQKVTIPFLDRPTYTNLHHAIKTRLPFYAEFYAKEEKNQFLQHLFRHHPWNLNSEERKAELLARDGGYARSVVVNPHTTIGITNHHGKKFSEADNDILRRFGAVLEQTYTRFLDLRQAEKQAREAKIEAALEKVRSRSLAMHKSEELKDVIQVVYEQFVQLDIPAEHTGFMMDYREREDFHSWIADKFGSPAQVTIPYFDCIYYNRFNEAKKKGIDFFATTLNLEEKNRFYEDLFQHVPGFPEESKRIIFSHPGFTISTVLLENVALYIENFTGIPFTDEENAILMRFGRVFQQTYTRFLDLQKAEAQVREAQIEAALEKVRSRTLAMVRSDELAETAAVLFRQLILLGIEPNRLYIILMKEDMPDMEAWVTDEDGSRVSMGFTGYYTENVSLAKMYSGWKEKRPNLVIDMEGYELQQYFEYLHNQLKVPFKGGLEQKRRVQHIAYFSHGLIGMASPDPQPAETLLLLERFAAVFNLTYTRFNDLKIAEAHALQAEQDLIEIKAAKQKAEEALTELKATQKQLIQSEKMASLGELTAGIAHEIQNPLNFVNNFSEVSNELLDEMNTEIDKGDLKEVKVIAADIKQNLEKINHHGKRAEAIVKGMLQHSRKSSGRKEATDINALCDEYLRLAYHGMKAKDRSFNATFIGDFDPELPKVMVVPQDIGRVVLNLITNSFYAVNQRSKANEKGYKPEVVVETKKTGKSIQITVSDNGNGIPDEIKEKIFQPFFTTKPTGQGTGLGLSLSYDIVKAHAGELTVNSREGAGCEFIMHIPII